MAHPLARVRNGFLEDPGRDETHAGVPVGSTEWYSWLTQHRSFRFEHPSTPYTARREQRPGGWYWYASRRTEGTLHTLYLGRSEDLTLERLEAVAQRFAPSSLRLIWRPERETYELRESQSNQLLPVAPVSQEWFAWLATIPSFTFCGQQGQLTVRQEHRPRGGTYWYAYHRDGDKVLKRYLGRTSALTLARLEEIAGQFTAPSVFPPEPEGPTHRPSPQTTSVPHDAGASALPSDRAPADRGASTALSAAGHDLRLATKLAVPRLRPKLVRRARLLTHLAQGLQATLTLVSAPAGSGKTTLLAQWLAESALPTAWVSLEPEDNDPLRFLSALIAALQRLDPQLGTTAFAFLHPPPPSPPPSPETVVALLVSDLHQQVPRDFILVLDDYHVITAEALHQALASFVEHAPPHLHLVIATRTDPILPLSRLRVRGELCEVRAAQLQFLPEETSTFLHAVMGLDLSAEEGAVLQERTEGWIAGLQLAALSLQGRSDVQPFLADFSGSHRYLVDYLVDEVLAHQPQAVQAFLLHTSILDRLTGPLCDAVTGRTGSDVLLEQLEHANLFLVPLDEHRLWYRYHHLFAEMLRVRVQREIGTDGLAALYTRASAWYEQNGMPAEAVEAALSAGDFKRAARFIDIDTPLVRSMLLGFGGDRTLTRWLERFPQEVLFTHAHLCLVYAFSLGSSETSDAYERPLAVAERLFQAEGNRTGLGRACLLRAFAAMQRGDGAQVVISSTQAFELLPADAILERSTAASVLAEGYRLGGEIAEAHRVLTEARPLHEQSGNVSNILNDTITLGGLLVMQGRLHQAAKVYTSVLEVAGERQHFAVSALMGLGNIARERNELDAAEEYLEQAVTLANKTQDTMRLVRASLMRARIIQARRDAERTLEAWASALGLAQAYSYTGLLEQVQAYQVRCWLQEGRMDAVIRWQKACPLSHDAPASYPQEVMALTLVRVVIAQGEAGEALSLLERWHRHARMQERTASEIEMLVLSALAYAQQGKREQAVQLLQEALLLASPEGYVRVFVDEGAPMVALLSLVLSRWKNKLEAKYIHDLLSVLQAEQPAHGSLPLAGPDREPPLEPLSSRERKVLRLLSAGFSNAEIAAELVVSVNTVRSQARSIYHKLNVKNRHEAVALARHWQLL